MQRKTKQQWLVLIEQFEASGLSQADFCKTHEINPKYFSLKRSKLLAPSESSSSPFVRATRQKSPAQAFTLVCGRVTVRCDATVSTSSLAQLITALA
ncbi:MAG: hypothetical protein WCY88_16695 [Spongiibacteraceae bacterium]